MKPIKIEVITIKKCEPLKHQLLVAIECGEDFTKVLFLNKTNEKQLFNENEESLVLDLVLFHSEDFEYAIKWIRDNAYVPEGGTHSVHITGYFTVEYQNQIKSILNREVLYIDEYLTIAVGCKFALECIGVENLLAKPVEFDTYGVENENEMLKMITNSYKKNSTDQKSTTNKMETYLFYVQGWSSACYYFDEDGLCEYFDAVNLGTQTLLGVSKCLINSNDCNKVIELASKGNQSNVDTTIKEKLDETIESPYGKFPSELPIFPFGKCEDHNIGREDLSKEDMSASLMGFHIENIIKSCTSIDLVRNISKIYFCGSLFDSEKFRKQLLQALSSPFVMIKPEILQFKESVILGALIYEGNHDRRIMKSSLMV